MTFRIAFDLDDTLISPDQAFVSELFPPPALVRILGFEPLRLHFKRLYKQLKKQKVEVWIYTYIYRLFWLYGVHLNGIINGAIHKERMKNIPKNISKYPPAFGIDALIDNSLRVYKEGQENNFTVVRVLPNDDQWYGALDSLLLKRQCQ
ncbi:hypothetical protein [Microscilla marina]|uniref:Uncharacterized protein n=1 Tax=Microscilla marina ATCC 23134 TaxID=313606 RepID=A1ZSK8_MICM2|nr:hypothetical protein [Microscilla marina]EAY26588.1 conserved hypothetical protein [Microscilla marina ATCC 23134]